MLGNGEGCLLHADLPVMNWVCATPCLLLDVVVQYEPYDLEGILL